MCDLNKTKLKIEAIMQEREANLRNIVLFPETTNFYLKCSYQILKIC